MRDSYKPITNTAWVRAQFCKLQKGALDSQVIKFTSCLPMVGVSLRNSDFFHHWNDRRHDIAEILLKVALKHQESNQIKFTLVPDILGDSFTHHDGMQFSTTDRDHDKHLDNCAKRFHGGWWYKACHMSNLNGRYLSGTSPYGEGINWYTWRGFYYSLKSAKMMIRKLH